MKRRKYRKQVTCRCSAYKFPHRLSGGKCTIENYVYSYFYEDRVLCTDCICNKTAYCEVAEGSEDVQYCAEVQELNRYYEVSLTRRL